MQCEIRAMRWHEGMLYAPRCPKEATHDIVTVEVLLPSSLIDQRIAVCRQHAREAAATGKKIERR